MKVRVTKSFRDKLNEQINFIAQDKPAAARKFKSEVLDRIRELSHMPYKNRKSIYFDKDEIRDLIYKGYVVVYKINESKKQIEVFGFAKHQNEPF